MTGSAYDEFGGNVLHYCFCCWITHVLSDIKGHKMVVVV